MPVFGLKLSKFAIFSHIFNRVILPQKFNCPFFGTVIFRFLDVFFKAIYIFLYKFEDFYSFDLLNLSANNFFEIFVFFCRISDIFSKTPKPYWLSGFWHIRSGFF